MAKTWKISEAASIALHAMIFLAATDKPMLSTREIALSLKVSEAHLSKVLQRLTKAGLVKATRGPRGGYSASRPKDEVTLLEVYEAIEGPLAPTSCLFGSRICTGGKCIMGDLLNDVDRQVADYLARTKLSDLAQCNPSVKWGNQ